MLVRDHMTAEPQCTTVETSVSKALEIMENGDFHRLPVVDENHCLIGLITAGLVSDSSGAKNTSLSIYELNYLLSRTKVGDIMIKDVVTISPDAMIDEAAHKMRKNGISVLPVVDDENHVLGIITENDLFDALVTLMGYGVDGTHFIISVPDVSGVVAKVAAVFGEHQINLNTFTVHRDSRGVHLYVVATSHCPEMKEHIEALSGYSVTIVRE